ncbi:hypothetical protein WR25_20426 isoform E [Diploscapter pachys]|uniref:PPM-type phosphatase domain-containing protein n=1 Tax=Diploscapter pachys TaxID=2018661 RepID=A0A2A2JMC3_9BILA|nr:hypothetical protein WR25_20426 isoform A [Diploscapter pachys]PAV62699.1 hypothetical protein WR25_20426 isoform B [Diploscapter pachys]PAV62700.1 hypothetical protein WR25_20426 isoform C [Diploscapter pachys]PAV62701.1 hypothetical protein WR25_20426 isoform D [Diploscapter pachys]PAV62702.1 hypothetical protein WR25_20426 isoform E [Diploscapter pachys]
MDAIANRIVSAVARGSRFNSTETQNGVKGSEAEQAQRIGMVVDVGNSPLVYGLIPKNFDTEPIPEVQNNCDSELKMDLVEKQEYPYSRPEFLYFSDEEINLASDQTIRPILCSKCLSKMPLNAGYAECINAGKTQRNEDQAAAKMMSLIQACNEVKAENGDGRHKRNSEYDDDPLSPGSSDSKSDLFAPRADTALFGIFDGHAGAGAAIVARKCLHEHIKTRLEEVLDMVLQLDRQEAMMINRTTSSYSISQSDKESITSSQLVCGALETAFMDMDDQIGDDKQNWKLPGGCAAICAVVFLGKIYIANAGDCRAVLATSEECRQLSKDLNPASERKRLQTFVSEVLKIVELERSGK